MAAPSGESPSGESRVLLSNTLTPAPAHGRAPWDVITRQPPQHQCLVKRTLKISEPKKSRDARPSQLRLNTGCLSGPSSFLPPLHAPPPSLSSLCLLSSHLRFSLLTPLPDSSLLPTLAHRESEAQSPPHPASDPAGLSALKVWSCLDEWPRPGTFSLRVSVSLPPIYA